MNIFTIISIYLTLQGCQIPLKLIRFTKAHVVNLAALYHTVYMQTCNEEPPKRGTPGKTFQQNMVAKSVLSSVQTALDEAGSFFRPQYMVTALEAA